MNEPQSVVASPYEVLGGADGIARFVNRFYDLMDSDPAFATLRAMHEPDLAPMRASLAGFLSGWSGGPRTWFDQNPGKCMMSAHGALKIDRDGAEQWCAAMARAMADCEVDATLAGRLNEAFARMAGAMAR
ncbi:globin [Sphingomonas sp. Root710]|uniref:group II truncated hemoglobin n=1 Tax=Sphingomonas sp. Root710 TaxID=1736594 RepID=UPI0006F3DC01|nr:group II truncated hemoglobin [Sphingomonas sp. Root710]KRB81197.1 globin [Sphingomonas sp. Root710]